MLKTNNDFFVVDAVSEQQIEAFSSQLLSREEEAALSALIRKGGPEGMEARNRLVEANMKFVTYLAKSYMNRGVDMDDLQSMGYEGLIHAAMKFDGDRNVRFCTYAAFWIKQAISRGIANEGSTVRIPIHMGQVMARINKAKQELIKESYTEPTPEEIADRANEPVDTVKEVLSYSYNIISMESTVSDDKKLTVEDFCADENADDPCKEAMYKDLQEVLEYALDKLDPKEALVLKLRTGMIGNHPMTLDEIATLPNFNVTRERVRQIEKKALEKIRRQYWSMKRLSEYAM